MEVGWLRYSSRIPTLTRIFAINWKRISPVFAGASPKGTLECVSAWLTDFRNDLERIDIPALVIHGDADRILPISATGKRTPEFVKGSKLVVIEGGPHGMTWTHAEQVNHELLGFLGRTARSSQAA
jgi:non-heme chloroperoxidase